MKTRSCLISHIGTSRRSHEDNFLINRMIILPETQKQISLQTKPYIKHFIQQDNTIQLFAISDGMGGHNAGEVASYITVSMFAQLEGSIQKCKNIEMVIQQCQQCFQDINHKLSILERENTEYRNMGATATLLIQFNKKSVILHLGDSRAYFYNGIKLNQITKDHTEGQRLLDLKILTEEEVIHFSSRKNLNKYIGMKVSNLKAEEYWNEYAYPGWFLLCSDGLTDVLTNQEIEQIMFTGFTDGNIEKSAQALLNRIINDVSTREKSNDNITLMIIQIEQ